jgi:hypothetical protein
MIQPLVMCCPRDLELLLLLLDSLRALKDVRLLAPIVTFEHEEWPAESVSARLRPYDVILILRGSGYGQWGWPSSETMLRMIGAAARQPYLGPDDYLWKVDSDVVMVSSKVFDLIQGADLFGSPHSQLTETMRFGPWGHLSGASIFLRVEVARRIGCFRQGDFSAIEHEMRRDGLCVNEDVVLTYAAQYAGGTRQDLTGPAIACTDPVGALLRREDKGWSVVHLAGERRDFGGFPVGGKWGMPALLRQHGWGP